MSTCNAEDSSAQASQDVVLFYSSESYCAHVT